MYCNVSKNDQTKLIDTDNIMVVTRGKGSRGEDCTCYNDYIYIKMYKNKTKKINISLKHEERNLPCCSMNSIFKVATMKAGRTFGILFL